MEFEYLIESIRAQIRETIRFELFNGSASASKTEVQKLPRRDAENQLHAVVYIAVLLLLYAAILAAVLIKYMLQEQKVASEHKLYRNFLARTRQLAVLQVRSGTSGDHEP